MFLKCATHVVVIKLNISRLLCNQTWMCIILIKTKFAFYYIYITTLINFLIFLIPEKLSFPSNTFSFFWLPFSVYFPPSPSFPHLQSHSTWRPQYLYRYISVLLLLLASPLYIWWTEKWTWSAEAIFINSSSSVFIRTFTSSPSFRGSLDYRWNNGWYMDYMKAPGVPYNI